MPILLPLKQTKNCDNMAISIKYNFSCLNSINSLVVVAELVKLSCRSGCCRHPQQPESPTTLKSGNKYRAESNYRKVLPTANLPLVFAISCKNCRQVVPCGRAFTCIWKAARGKWCFTIENDVLNTEYCKLLLFSYAVFESDPLVIITFNFQHH